MTSELQVHIQVVHFLRQWAKPEVMYWHTPNGELRDKRHAAKLKAMGTKPGVADLTFLLPVLYFPSEELRPHFLELKREGGTLSKPQQQFRSDVEALGCPYEIARTFGEAIEILSEWGCIQERIASALQKEKAA